MNGSDGLEQYVLLPARGLRGDARTTTPEAQEFLRSAHEAVGTRGVTVGDAGLPVRVVDSFGPAGAQLLELSSASALAVRALHPELRLVPVVYYTPAVVAPEQVVEQVARGRTRAASDTITLRVVSKKGGTPVANAFVVAFVDFANRMGAQGVTDAAGTVTLALGAPSIKLERLYVYPVDAHWSIIRKGVTVSTGFKVTLMPLDLGFTDGLRHFYGNAGDNVGAGVTVGVVDTGVAKHPDLEIRGGLNTVPGESPKDFGDNGRGHGTHVAGIIAARGRPPTGLRGVAPGVNLRAYRVFGQGQGTASSFAIARGIDEAVAAKCDLVNLSLGGPVPDPVIKEAVDDARARGSVCICASGNNDRAPVSFPAAEDMAVAVSGMGRKGTFPSNAAASDEVAAPFGTEKANFLAAFSNVGPQIDLTGPGVGIMSTFPGGYAEISGTSMACPAVTGAAARALAGSKALKAKRDAKRSAAIVKAAYAAAAALGFGPNFEGHGLPRPK